MGLGRTGQPTAHHGSRVIASLAGMFAPVARNSDYPTAPKQQSYTRNAQDAHMGPELGDGSFCSSHKIPLFVLEVHKSSSVCALRVATPCTIAPEDGVLAKTKQQHCKAGFGVGFGLGFFCFLVKSPLSICTM